MSDSTITLDSLEIIDSAITDIITVVDSSSVVLSAQKIMESSMADGVSAIQAFFAGLGFSGTSAMVMENVTLAIMLLVLCFLVDIIAKQYLTKLLEKIVNKTKVTWDDKLVERGVFLKIAHIAPAMVAYWVVPIIFKAVPRVETLIEDIVLAYIVIVVTNVLTAIIDAGQDLYRELPVSKDRPIKGYLQIAKLLLIVTALILIVSIILEANPLGILSGLGAMSAVLLIVFKDPLMGLVASISLAANNMVRIGDWIEMPKYNADGDVIDITLQSIVVQNFDKTITSIPIYSLISGSFKNWRGMSESKGRRIKRSINIDMDSIHFMSSDEYSILTKNRLIADYLNKKGHEILAYGEENKDKAVPVRKLTNVGTFRAYMKEYLAANNEISDELTFLVRQLAPTSQGLPLEIYVFSKNKDWVAYEDIQSDIFDHLIAALPEFGLRVFQDPTGSAFRDSTIQHR